MDAGLVRFLVADYSLLYVFPAQRSDDRFLEQLFCVTSHVDKVLRQHAHFAR